MQSKNSILFFLIFLFPLGVAIQNIGGILGGTALFIYLMIPCLKNKDFSHLFPIKTILVPVIMSIFYVVWMVISTYLNTTEQTFDNYNFIFGYLAWILMPLFIPLAFQDLTRETQQKLFRFFAFLCFVWGGVAISQQIIGWKVVGSSFVFAENHRPQGFYSHPLTLAYASLLTWPMAMVLFIKNFKNKFSWMLFLGSFFLVLTTGSRTVQAGVVLVMFVNILIFLKGRSRYLMVGALVVGLLTVVFTENPISRKFRSTIAGTEDHAAKDYPDDRIAFWHAHWEMVKERPIFGHGFAYTTEYRDKYYQRIGLEDLPKKYPAHNMFLQILANGGIVALVIFLIWFFWYIKAGHFLMKKDFTIGLILLETFVLFALASLTQNSFQDSDVRYGFALLAATVNLVILKYKIT